MCHNECFTVNAPVSIKYILDAWAMLLGLLIKPQLVAFKMGVHVDHKESMKTNCPHRCVLQLRKHKHALARVNSQLEISDLSLGLLPLSWLPCPLFGDYESVLRTQDSTHYPLVIREEAELSLELWDSFCHSQCAMDATFLCWPGFLPPWAWGPLVLPGKLGRGLRGIHNYSDATQSPGNQHHIISWKVVYRGNLLRLGEDLKEKWKGEGK